MDYFGARYFSGAQGRFTNTDQPGADWNLDDPQSWNLYGYVRNNPLKYIDPSGTRCVILDGGGVGDNGIGEASEDLSLQTTHGISLNGTTEKVVYAGVYANAVTMGDVDLSGSKDYVVPYQGRYYGSNEYRPRGPAESLPRGKDCNSTLHVAQSTQELVQPVSDWLSQRDPLRTSNYTAVGASMGFWDGGTLGFAGGPISAVTIPGGAAGGTALGGAIGGLGGLVLCSTGSGPSGSSDGPSTGGHKYSGKTVAEILKGKGSIKNDPLEAGAPTWESILNTKWEDIDKAAKAGKTGYDTIRKLLTDGRFNK